ncbi:MAG: hypothetical protein CMF96_06280 [Candidatus Marinimicrobia bacterium]|nr:hypothetical protein [Candidatus Neomarinimicrobiota bacterium]|tara:strand:- start:487 stop:1188 length:702 start_codon:yes stop_codon:yes gene_type:complete
MSNIKNIPEVLILNIFNYLYYDKILLEKNNKSICYLKIIYKFIQLDWYFYKFFHFKIDKCFNENYKFNNNISIINICKKGKIGFLNKYINYFVDFNKKRPYTEYTQMQGIVYSPIYIAAENGNLNIIKRIYENNKNINLNIKGPFNTTPLIIATKKGYIEMVKYLINNLDHDQIISRDRNNRIALHWACIIGYTEIVKILLKFSNHNHEQDLYNKTPKMYAEEYGYYDIYQLL